MVCSPGERQQAQQVEGWWGFPGGLTVLPFREGEKVFASLCSDPREGLPEFKAGPSLPGINLADFPSLAPQSGQDSRQALR